MSNAVLGAQVIARAAQLLRLVSERTEAGWLVAELVAKSGLTRPTVYRLLAALDASGLVEQDVSTKRWHLGPESYVLGTLAAGRFNIEHVAQPTVIRIADLTEESAFLSIRRAGESVCLLREEGAYPIRTHVLQPGDRFPLGVGSAGLAILSALPDADVAEVIETNKDRYPLQFPNYSPMRVSRLVAQTREAGYAVNQGLLLPGSWGVAAAVYDSADRPVAALSITAIEARLQGSRLAEVGQLLIKQASELSETLKTNRGVRSR